MITSVFRNPTGPVRILWRAYLALAVLSGLLSLALILGTGSAGGGVFGLSILRLGMAFAILLASLAIAAILVEDRLRPERAQRHLERLLAHLDRRAVWSSLAVSSALIFLGTASFLSLLPDLQSEPAAIAADRLLPGVAWAAALSALTLVALLALRHGRDVFRLRPRGRLFYGALLAFGGLFLAWSWVARAILPTEAPRVGWNQLGTVLIGAQVFLAWIACAILMALSFRAARPKRESSPTPHSKPLWRFGANRIDLALGVLIWLTAVILWTSTPLTISWFVTEPSPPNFELYPNSDASGYDLAAQSALIGEGYSFYNEPYIRRALLAFYMTGLHLLAGQSYDRVIFLQIMLLALLPVGLYCLARRLHNRYTGLLLSGLVILREVNSIQLAGDMTTSHAKLLMADLPAALLVVGLSLLAIRWLQRLQHPDTAPPVDPRLGAFAWGGVLGLSMLVRLETLVFFLPLVLISAAILWSRSNSPRRARFSLWLQSSLLAFLGVLLVIAPWVYRNYQISGRLFIDHPYFQMDLLRQRFNPERGLFRGPSEVTSSRFDQPSVVHPVGSSGSRKVLLEVLLQENPQPTPTPNLPVTEKSLEDDAASSLRFIGQNLAALGQVAFAHILNSQMQSLLILPNSSAAVDSGLKLITHRSPEKWWSDCCVTRSAIRNLPYWRKWDGRFASQSILPLAFNLLAIAYGLHLSWKANRWPGLAPIFLLLTYTVFNGLLRNSGGRYLLPVSWAMLLYFSIGLSEATRRSVGYLTGRAIPADFTVQQDPPPAARIPTIRSASLRFIGVGVALLLLGSLTPLLERSFPERYDSERTRGMFLALTQTEQITPAEHQNIQTYLVNGAWALGGRALYPRFFPRNAGDEVNPGHPFEPQPYPRLGFYLLEDAEHVLSMPVNSRPASFPNASDVLVVTCPDDSPLAVALFHPNGALDKVYLRSPFPSPPYHCPLPNP